jgi:glycosyltransferase involved in cell wall biosynthesis
MVRLAARNDVVHLHTPMPESPIVAGSARLMGKPTLITHHGDVVMPSGLLNGIIQRAMDGSIKLGMHLADRIVVHSADYHRHSRFLASVVPKIENIYPPVTMPTPQADAVAAWRKDLGLENRRVVGFAGRFVEEKGFDYLLQAVPLVRERLPDAHFVFAGDTDVAYERFFDRWRSLFERESAHLTHLGLLLDAQQMANFYAMADVFVLPSRTDCFAIVQIEALLSGTPLVTTDIPGAREIVKVTGGGRLVRPQDPEALAEGIVEVLQQPEPLAPSRDAIRGVFDPDSAIDEYEELLLRLVESRRGRRWLRRRESLSAPNASSSPRSSVDEGPLDPGAEEHRSV